MFYRFVVHKEIVNNVNDAKAFFLQHQNRTQDFSHSFFIKRKALLQ